MVASDPRRRRPRLLVLGAGAAQLGLLEASRRLGVDVVAADADRDAPGFALAGTPAVVSTEDEEGVERLARAERVTGLVSPGADWPVLVAARVAARLGLQHPLGPGTAARATSKSLQRVCFAASGVPHPRALDPAEPSFPCVVKAPDRQGQRGLALVRHAGDLPNALAAAAAVSRSGAVLVEELVEGPEVTVNAFSLRGRFQPLAVTDRLTADPPAFGVALAHVWPSEHAVEEAVEAARAAVTAIGVRDGPSYTQLRLAADGPRVLETAARLGGGHDADLVRAVTGIDLHAAAIALALGERPTLAPSAPIAAAGCVRFLVAPPGRLRAVDGAEAAAALPGVRFVRLHRRPGWLAPPLERGADRAGAVLAVGDTRAEALERAGRAAESVRFHVDADAS